jgi:hypothetical protein
MPTNARCYKNLLLHWNRGMKHSNELFCQIILMEVLTLWQSCLIRPRNLQQWLGDLRVAGVENTDSRHTSTCTLCRRILVNSLPILSLPSILGSQTEMSPQGTLCLFSRQINPSLSLSLPQSKTSNISVCSTSEFIYTSYDFPLPQRVFLSHNHLSTQSSKTKKKKNTWTVHTNSNLKLLLFMCAYMWNAGI